MLDFRLYRLAFIPALLAFVAMMFSLQGVPEPLEPVVPPASFEAQRAAATARAIANVAPERPPGSEADSASADLVTERLGSIRAGTVSEQQVSASFEGEETTVRNVSITLPGDSAQTVVVIAGRDSPGGPGAASSAAATGALVELASMLGVSGHAKTYVLASTSGSTEGAAGARAVIGGLPDPEAVEAVVVISQPGAPDPEPPYVIATSTGPNRTAAQLATTAELAVSDQTGREHAGPGGLAQIARLAFPSGLGLQAPLIDAGHDAVAISSAGERPLDAGGSLREVSVETLGDFGRAAAAVVNAIDIAPGPLRQGPEPYVEIGDNLVPGWAIAILALTLLLPAGLAAVDATARALRAAGGLDAALVWALARAAPALAGLAALLVLAFAGLVPRPSFPFDPGRFDPGAAGIASLILIVAAVVAAAAFAGRRIDSRGALPEARLAAAGVVSVVAAALCWVVNPYLGLLVVPAAHAWLIVAAGASIPLAALATLVALGPLLLALGAVAGALELGALAPWTFMLMVSDGQIGLWTAVSLCLLAGGLIAALGASRRGRAAPPAAG